MGRIGNLCICGFCGKITPRNRETTCFIKCLTCQEEGKTELLELKIFLERKREMLERMRGVKEERKNV